LDKIHIIEAIFVFLFSASFSSFATVLCYRIPREIPLGITSHVRSKCPHCDRVIPFYENVPIFAYLFLRGKCSKCKKRIPLRYFLIEITVTILISAAYYLLKYWAPLQELDEVSYWTLFFFDLYFIYSLIVLTFIDIEFRIIPDRFSIGNWLIALALLGLRSDSIWNGILGGLAGFGFFFILAWGYEKLKGIEGLGFGDVKMMGWLGTWLGLSAIPGIVLIGSISGLVWGLIAMIKSKEGMKTAIPFGPFLAFAAMIIWVLKIFGVETLALGS
jgi:leader peptidase (prepilin peptidase)/N-methyltransferase